MKKALDRVWYDGLIHKLHTFTDAPLPVIKLIQYFLSSHSFRIKINDTFSSTRSIKAGVLQKSCVSSHLSIFYINDMPSTNNFKTALFADDTMFYTDHRHIKYAAKSVQNQLDLSYVWL
ncbi:Reverse transcriptase domain [Cinara cedri]|uniref:Reverse transcriptase domain n=1 Tax=Cinara cedri TaxID=506608 RepID=A0A5E4M3G9_9HEMI|nr:Reverse transcriptase domain [Cinara cedri]